MLLRELLSEAWSEKYKRSINCANPKGFSQRAHCQGRKKDEDQHPNEKPLGPEFKPTMPAGTVRVDVSDVYDWYKLGQHISNLKGLGKHDFGKGAPSTIMAFGSEPEEHKYIKDLEKTGLSTTDIDPVDPKQPKGMKRQKVDPTYNVAETKKRKRKKIRRAAYGPGPYGLYGYDSGYSGEGGGGDGGGGVEEAVTDIGTVSRIDSKPIRDFASDLKSYKHTDDWSQSGVDTGNDSYWQKKNLKVSTTKGLYAGDPHRTALYATGNAHQTRYVEFKLDGQPIVYFDKNDLPKIRSRKTFLTVFDASNFRKLPTGEYFSENPGKPLEQKEIKDPFQYIADQGWIVRITNDLEKVFRQVKAMHKSGKISQYGAEGMNENIRVNEFAPAGSGGNKPPRGPKNTGRDPWDNGDFDDPYSRPEPEYYSRSIDFFGRFEADHFDDEEFDEKTGVFKGYWDDEEGRVQIAYFKFDDPRQAARDFDDSPGMGWYYEPQMESTTENFADGRNPQDKGDSKRHNVPTKGKISTLRKIAKQGGRRGQLAHWMANMKSGRRKTNESREDINIVDALKMFLPIVMHILDLDKLPRIKLHKEIRDTDQPTFGRFLNDDMVIEVGLANRHPNDILRTLAHELVHFKQLLDGEIGPHSGDTGSPQENEANAKAGIIMRVFNKKYPEFLDVKPLMLSETASVGTTSAGNIASVVSPHIAIGNIKSYGKGASASPPKAKQVKNKDGTAKNALDINTNIFGGGAVKR